MIKAKKFILASMFDGEPKLSDFELKFEELPELGDHDVLVEAIFWSVDPYMRVQMPQFPVNSQMIGEQIGRVIKSNDSNYPVGSFVWCYFGWRDFTIFNNLQNEKNAENIPPYIIEPLEYIPLSARLGALGMPGNTAYFGLELCKAKPGETIVVSGAAGAVGHLVGQIAKIRGCKVIGISGSDEKCKWLVEEMGFDHAINYKCENVEDSLKLVASNGVDMYFDNVGGELSSTVMQNMNQFGRVAVCGSISTYNAKTPKAPILQPTIIAKQLKVEGFIVSRWFNRWNEGVAQLTEWIETGKLKYRETMTDGFENLPLAFIGMLRGENTGKALVRK